MSKNLMPFDVGDLVENGLMGLTQNPVGAVSGILCGGLNLAGVIVGGIANAVIAMEAEETKQEQIKAMADIEKLRIDADFKMEYSKQKQLHKQTMKALNNLNQSFCKILDIAIKSGADIDTIMELYVKMNEQMLQIVNKESKNI